MKKACGSPKSPFLVKRNDASTGVHVIPPEEKDMLEARETPQRDRQYLDRYLQSVVLMKYLTQHK